MRGAGWAAMAVMMASPALAETSLCAERPGQTTPSCAIPVGRGIIESSLASWSVETAAGSRRDSVTLLDTLLRVGIGGGREVQVGIAPLTLERMRDNGLARHDRGAGDATLAVKQQFGGGEGPVAVKAYLTLPTGSGGQGAGDWQAGVMLPVQITAGGVDLGLTPEIGWRANAESDGHHALWGGAVSAGVALGKLSVGAGVSAYRDEDPAGAQTQALADFSLALPLGDRWQVDASVATGLKHQPDFMLGFGLSHLF